MKKFYAVISLFLFAFNNSFAQAPGILWKKCIGGGGNEAMSNVHSEGNEYYDYALPTKSLIPTSDGGYYIAGQTNSSSGDVPVNSVYNQPGTIAILKLDANRNIIWKKTLGGLDEGGKYDYFDAILETSDKGCIVIGETESVTGNATGNHGKVDIIIGKFSSTGDLEWTKMYGGKNVENGRSIVQTDDGGYVFLGVTYSNGGQVEGYHGLSDVWMVKITKNGKIAWQKCIGTSGYENAIKIEKAANNGFVYFWQGVNCTGLTITKTDSLGNTVSEGCVPGFYFYGNISGTADGGYIIAGQGASGQRPYGSAMVIKVDSAIHFQWQKTLEGSKTDNFNDARQTRDGGYIIVGNTQSDDGDLAGLGSYGCTTCTYRKNDAWVVKLDATGQLEWQKLLGGSGGDMAVTVLQEADDNYLFLGETYSQDGEVTGNHLGNYVNYPTVDWWLVKLGTVRTRPAINSVIAKEDSVCTNATTLLTAAGVAGTDSVVTWWTGPAGTGNYIDTGLTIIAQPGTYYARVTGYIDSAAEASVTVHSIPASTSDTVVTTCNSFDWNGTVYTASGNYIYTTINAAGCDSTATLHLTITTSTSSQGSITSCNTYTWHGTVYTTSGNYSYHTTNAEGCDSTANLYLTIHSILSTNKSIDATCFGAATGSVTVTATGGGEPYLYKLRSGGIYKSPGYFGGLKAGTYKISIQDAFGCTGSTGTVTVGQPQPLAATITTKDSRCNGAPDGSLTVTASGGTSPYLYKLEKSGIYQSSGYLTGLKAGSYVVSIKDSKGCTFSTNTITIGQPYAITANYTTTDATCYGIADGSVIFTAAGGTGPYQYKLRSGGVYKPSGIFSGLKAGIYKFYIKDENDCAKSINVTINQPEPVIADYLITDASCIGSSDGAISVTASGGNGDYEYQLTRDGVFQSSANFANLQAGNHIIYIKDKNGCGATSSEITIKQNLVSCNSLNNKNFIKTKEITDSYFEVLLSPNPVVSVFKVLVDSKAVTAVQLRVIDLNGQVKYNATGFPGQPFIFGEELPSGIYLVELRQGNKIKTIKTIKIR